MSQKATPPDEPKRDDEKQRNTFWYIWPDVSIGEGQVAGMKAGAVAAGWLAFVQLTVLGELFAASQSHEGGQAAAMSEHWTEIAVAFPLAAIAGGLAWLLWNARSRPAAWGILLWVAAEALMRMLTPGSGFIIALLALVCAVSGVRASQAYWKSA